MTPQAPIQTTRFVVAQPRVFVPFTMAGLIAIGVNTGALFLFIGIIGLAIVIAVSAAFTLSTGANLILQKSRTFGEKSPRRLSKQRLLFVAASLLHNVARVGSILAEMPTTAAVNIVGLSASIRIFRAAAFRETASFADR